MTKKVYSIVLNPFTHDSRVWKQATSLSKNGYDVEVLAMHEPGLPIEENINGVQVHRVKLRSKNWSKNFYVQILKYFEFCVRAWIRCRKDADIIHCNDLGTLPIGHVLKKISTKQIKVVYDAHEYETETMGMHGRRKKIAKAVEGFLVRYADSVITVSGKIADAYVQDYGISRPMVLYNAPFLEQLEQTDLFRKELGIEAGTRIFLYQGALADGRGIHALIECFANQNDSRSVLVFMGYGALTKQVEAAARDNDRIFFHPAVPPETVLRYSASADFGISFIEDRCLNYRYCLPNKIFEYVMAGIPICVSNLPEMREFVESQGVGLVAAENSVAGLTEMLDRALNADYRLLRENVERSRKQYCWENEERELLSLYDGPVKGSENSP